MLLFSQKEGIMKINELAKMAGIHPETIRLYRTMGFLHPKKLANGYYDYTTKDYTSLGRLRKLRELDFSLEEIEKFGFEENLDQVIQKFDETEVRLKQEMQTIQEKIRYIQFEKSHIASSLNTKMKGNVSLNQSIDEKIDFYPPFDPEYFPVFDTTKNHFFYTTTAIFISKDILNGPVEDRVIKTKVGIGTYRSIIDRLNINISDKGVHVPNGLSISQTIETSDLEHINILDLAPMMNYAKKIKKPFLSDTTGYLVHIHYKDGVPVYLIRIRACIEENDIISPDRI